LRRFLERQSLIKVHNPERGREYTEGDIDDLHVSKILRLLQLLLSQILHVPSDHAGETKYLHTLDRAKDVRDVSYTFLNCLHPLSLAQPDFLAT
jgi:hypothetical protein